MSRFFLAVYTHAVKQYCDVEFFNKLGALTYSNKMLCIANNSEESSYNLRLQKVLGSNIPYKQKLFDVKVPRGENWANEKFIRRVTHSCNFLRKRFLNSDCDYFVIVESDVMVPPNLLELFMEVKDKADIIGGLYYQGYHPTEWFDSIFQCYIEVMSDDMTVLSGCTLYSRRLLEQIEFRYDQNKLTVFPDAHMTHDARDLGYMTGNYTKIKCEHRHDSTGQRGFQLL